MKKPIKKPIQKPIQKKVKKSIPVIERREFYKEAKNKLVILAGFSTLTLLSSAGVSYYAHQENIKNIYFSIKDDGTVVEMIPFSEPNLKDSVVTSWVQKALIETFDFNFHNMKQSLSESSMSWFTSSGGSKLIKALQEEGHFDAVLNRKLILTYTPKHAPIVVKKYLNQRTGKYTWELQAQGSMTYINQKGKRYTDNTIFNVVVERVSLRQDPTGIGISKIIMTK